MIEDPEPEPDPYIVLTDPYIVLTDPDPGGHKTYEPRSGTPTLLCTLLVVAG
jgi:hypothetical protein